MFIFFKFGRLWAADLRLQCVTSCILGAAVCGMHYTGKFTNAASMQRTVRDNG
jgi:NO-binding membrane sensor protein with MHYT domain